MAPSGERDAVAVRVQLVLERIRRAAERVGRPPGSVRLVVASKGIPAEGVAPAVEAGVQDIGENRLQEALPKIAALNRLRAGLRWHFIGKLQRRKVRVVVGAFDMVHSVDSLPLAEEIDRRARAAGVIQKVLLEVNLGQESAKAGFEISDMERALPAIDAMASLEVRGLMAIPPYTPDAEGARPHFRRLRELARSLSQGEWKRMRMQELSMGMSLDYEVAVEEGATLVRVGTAIFGARDA